MRTFTRPRLLPVYTLRPGDEIAVYKGKTGVLIHEWQEFIDAQLTEKLAWVAVADVIRLTADDTAKRRQRLGQEASDGSRDVLIVHTKGEKLVGPNVGVYQREGIEFDPWTYIRPAREEE